MGAVGCPPGSQASSRGEAKDSALLSSRDGYILELTVWPKMSQASCGVWSKEASVADVIVHLGCKEGKVTFKS